MRILVSADIHLGAPIRSVALRNPDLGARLKQASRDVFTRIVDIAIDEQVDALVLAGDVFDNGQPEVRLRAFLLAQLARAARAGVPTVLIRGNHDAVLDHAELGDLGAAVHLLDRTRPTVQIGNVAFHGLSFDMAHAARSFLPDYPAPLTGMRNVGVMHTSLGGAVGHDPYAPCSETDMFAHGYDLWCLGHIHAPFDRSDGAARAVMPGIPQPRHFGERFGGHVVLATLDASGRSQLEQRPVAQLGFAQCEVDLTDVTDGPETMTRLTKALRDQRSDDCDMAVRLVVTSAHHTTEAITALALECLEGITGVYLDKVKHRAPSKTSTVEDDDLMRLMRAEIGSDAFRLASQQALEELRDALPTDLRLALTDQDMESLLEDALQDVAARVRAAG